MGSTSRKDQGNWEVDKGEGSTQIAEYLEYC